MQVVAKATAAARQRSTSAATTTTAAVDGNDVMICLDATTQSTPAGSEDEIQQLQIKDAAAEDGGGQRRVVACLSRPTDNNGDKLRSCSILSSASSKNVNYQTFQPQSQQQSRGSADVTDTIQTSPIFLSLEDIRTSNNNGMLLHACVPVPVVLLVTGLQ